MQSPVIPEDESERLSTLQRAGILDPPRRHDTARSDGLGRGATFTILLPLQQDANGGHLD